MDVKEIQARVQQELDLRHKDVVLGVFKHMMRRHNAVGTCNCDYCSRIPEYVAEKRKLQRLKRITENDHLYDFHQWLHSLRPANMQRNIFAEIDMLGFNIKYRKKQQDALKVLH